MKLHTSLLLYLAAEKNTEARIGFWEAWDNYFKGSSSTTTPAPAPVEVMPTRQMVVPARVVDHSIPAYNCFDKFTRCSQWSHACSNKAIAGLCAKTCGLCENQIQESAPSLPVYVAPPKPVISKPIISMPAAPVPVPVQSVNTGLCSDKFSRCNLWSHKCQNKAIMDLCAKTCNLCNRQIQVAPVQIAPMNAYASWTGRIPAPVQLPIQPMQPVKPIRVSRPIQVVEPVQTYQYVPGVPQYIQDQALNAYKPIVPIAPAVPTYIQKPAEPVAPVVPDVPVYIQNQVYSPIPVQPVAPLAPVTTGCVDKFTRCAKWRHQCSNQAIAGLCQRTCGLCNQIIPEPAVWEPVIPEPVVVEPVIPEPIIPEPVVPEPQVKPINLAPVDFGILPATLPVTDAPVTEPAATTAAPPAETEAQTEAPTEVPTEAVTTAAPAVEEEEEEVAADLDVVDDDVESSGTEPLPVEDESESLGVPPVAEETSEEVEEASGEPIPVTIEEEVIEPLTTAPLCKDFIINCAEYNNSQYKICDARPGDEYYTMYRAIQDACRETCGFCDQNSACSALKEFCDEEDVATTCPGTCAGLD